jgi:heme exporter protein D
MGAFYVHFVFCAPLSVIWILRYKSASRRRQALACPASRLPRLMRDEASNTAGRVHQLQAFLLFLRGHHYTVYIWLPIHVQKLILKIIVITYKAFTMFLGPSWL